MFLSCIFCIGIQVICCIVRVPLPVSSQHCIIRPGVLPCYQCTADGFLAAHADPRHATITARVLACLHCMILTHCFVSPAVVPRFQRWAPTTTSDLTFTMNMVRSRIDIKLYYLGSAGNLRRIMMTESGLASFPNAAYEAIECSVRGSRWWLANSDKPLACNNNITTPQRLDQGLVTNIREASKYASAYFRKYIPLAGMQELVNLVNLATSPYGGNWRMFQLKVYGGVFETFGESFNAFPHRRGTFMVSDYGIAITSGPNSEQITRRNTTAANAAWAWYAKARSILSKYETGDRYNGYISADDQVRSYFGNHYPRLQQIKTQYDPDNVFRSILSVPPAAV